MKGSIRTRRWNDPGEPGDGLRLLVTRFRPRGVSKAKETWDEWWKEIGPSAELLADFKAEKVDFPGYRKRFLTEMAQPQARFRLQALKNRLAAGETITLLCSSSCPDPARCHRSILAELLAR